MTRLPSLPDLLRALRSEEPARFGDQESDEEIGNCHQFLEALEGLPFEQVFALRNARDDDDPAGPGTAPGVGFGVSGLSTRTSTK